MTLEERVNYSVTMDEVIAAVNQHLDKAHGLLDPSCLQIARTKLREVRMWSDEALNIDNLKFKGK